MQRGSPAAPSLAAGEARLRDPAHRDQDGTTWRRGRFAERVRRQWNVVQMSGEASGEAELDELAAAIQAKVGGDVASVRARLAEFAALDEVAGPPADDPLVRPGAPAE
jgi:hypothetical protein